MFNIINVESRDNVGTLDRAARVVIGLVLLSLAWFGPQSAWGYIGIIPLVTGLFGFCPVYRLLGISTCPMQRSR